MFSKKKKIWCIAATVILLILAGILSLNIRSQVTTNQLDTVVGTPSKQIHWAKGYYWNEVYSRANGNDRFFLQLNTGLAYPTNILQCYKALYEAEKTNPVYISFYAIHLAVSNLKETRAEFLKVAEEWKRLDPNNGMPYFLKAFVLAKDAVAEKKTIVKTTGKQKADIGLPEYEIKDKAAAELAVLEYKAGLKKKYASCYTDLAIRKKLGSAYLKRDPLGEMQRISIAASCVPLQLLGLEQDLALRMAVIAEQTAKDGKRSEALELVESGRKYIMLRLENEFPALINVLVHHSICNRWLDAAHEIKDEKMIALYDKVAKDFDSWRSSRRPNPDELKKHGGMFTQTLASAIKVDIPVEDYKPERMINYLIIDQYGLTALWIQMTMIIILLAFISGIFFLFKRKAQWIQLPIKTYCILGVAGILLPLAIQLIWTHVDALSGRSLSIGLNQTNLNLMAKYQVLISPLYFGILCCILLVKKGNAKPLDCIWNLILPLSVYLFLTIAILRTVQDIEISCYTKQDKLIHSECGFTAMEEKAIKELSGKLKENLKSPQTAPIKK